jgi:hypothetical protein
MHTSQEIVAELKVPVGSKLDDAALACGAAILGTAYFAGIFNSSNNTVIITQFTLCFAHTIDDCNASSYCTSLLMVT